MFSVASPVLNRVPVFSGSKKPVSIRKTEKLIKQSTQVASQPDVYVDHELSDERKSGLIQAIQELGGTLKSVFGETARNPIADNLKLVLSHQGQGKRNLYARWFFDRFGTFEQGYVWDNLSPSDFVKKVAVMVARDSGNLLSGKDALEQSGCFEVFPYDNMMPNHGIPPFVQK